MNCLRSFFRSRESRNLPMLSNCLRVREKQSEIFFAGGLDSGKKLCYHTDEFGFLGFSEREIF